MGKRNPAGSGMEHREVGIRASVEEWLVIADALEEVADLRWLECEVPAAERESTVERLLANRIRDAVAEALEGDE